MRRENCRVSDDEDALGNVRVLFIPGGGNSVNDYFPQLATLLETRATVIEVDPPGLDIASGRRWLRLSDHARWLAETVGLNRGEPVVVVAHSLGGLVALRLALDEPDAVAGLLLLDPSPLMPAALLPARALQLLAALRSGATYFGRRGRRSVVAPRSVPTSIRLLWYLVLDGGPLAADLAAGRLAPIPTIVVSAGEHTSDSATRRTHERLVSWIAGAKLEVWEGTTHPLHIQQPGRVADATLALLERVSNSSR
jgi:pimeloyl-ACP methyl ester carboxylesterase